MPIGDTNFGGVFLPQPQVHGADQDANVEQTQQVGNPAVARDVMSLSEQAVRTARVTVPGDDRPPEPRSQEMGQLATSSFRDVGANTGNPWFAANPLVAVSKNMLAMFEAMRESKVDTLALDVSMLNVTMDLARSSAKIAIAIGQNEANTHIIEAISAGINMAAAVVSIGTTLGASKMASMKKSGKDLEAAKTEQATAKAEVDTANKKLEALNAETAAKQAKINQKTEALKNLDSSVGTDPDTVKAQKNESRIKAQEELTQAQADFDSHMTEVNKAKADAANAKKILDDKTKDLEVVQKNFDRDEQMIRELGNSFSQLTGAFSGVVSGFAKAGLATQKGQLQADQQILAAVQENTKRIQQTLQESWKSTSEAMQGLLQAIQKIDDQTAQAMQMTRGG